jgi:hypothetical protein
MPHPGYLTGEAYQRGGSGHIHQMQYFWDFARISYQGSWCRLLGQRTVIKDSRRRESEQRDAPVASSWASAAT